MKFRAYAWLTLYIRSSLRITQWFLPISGIARFIFNIEQHKLYSIIFPKDVFGTNASFPLYMLHLIYLYIWDFEIEFSIECIERALKERHSSLLVGGSAWLHIDIIHSTQSFSTLFMTLVLEFTPVALSLIDIMNYTLYVLSLCRKLNINSLVNGRKTIVL